MQGSEFVQMKKIDNIIKDNKLPYPNVMLMDIDGHELLAMKGMKHIFTQTSLRWAIIETNKTTDEFVINFMKKYSFSVLDENEDKARGAWNRVFIRK